MTSGGELGSARDLQKPHLTPLYHATANLVYCANAADVDTVVVDGELLVEGREIHGLDLPALCREVQGIAHEITGRL